MLRKGADTKLLKLHFKFEEEKRERELEWFLNMQERKLREVNEILKKVGERNKDGLFTNDY